MTKRASGIILAAAALLFMIVGCISAPFASAENGGYYSAASIISYKRESCGYGDNQSFVDGWLTQNAGRSEADWYALCLSRTRGCDFSTYLTALESASSSADLNAAEHLRVAVIYNALGGKSLNLSAIAEDCRSGLGIMSEIYTLILYANAEITLSVSSDEVLDSLISRQLPDGGWALSGNRSDIDVTAMALQGLAYYRGSEKAEEAIASGLARLSQLQRDNGGFTSYGKANAESCAQVITALSCLGTDASSDADFIKNGCTVIDALMSYSCASGGFSHTQGGAENYLATVQACLAFTALECDGASLFSPAAAKDEPLPVQTATRPPENTVVTEAVVTVETVDTSAETAAPTEQVVSGTTTTSETTVMSGTTSAAETNETTSENSELTSTDKTACITVTTTANPSVSVADSAEESNGIDGFKPFAAAGIGAVFAVSQIYTAARKQFSWKRFGTYAAVSAVCIGAVFSVNIQTPKAYYSRHIDEILPDSLTVTMSVSCEVIGAELDGETVIIPETEYVLLEDDTAFTLLERVLAYNKIPFDYNGTSGTGIYIRGIDGIYEMDYGEMSGWMYKVNGQLPDAGCDSLELSDGDIIEWVYTRNIGQDIGEEEYS